MEENIELESIDESEHKVISNLKEYADKLTRNSLLAGEQLVKDTLNLIEEYKTSYEELLNEIEKKNREIDTLLKNNSAISKEKNGNSINNEYKQANKYTIDKSSIKNEVDVNKLKDICNELLNENEQLKRHMYGYKATLFNNNYLVKVGSKDEYDEYFNYFTYNANGERLIRTTDPSNTYRLYDIANLYKARQEVNVDYTDELMCRTNLMEFEKAIIKTIHLGDKVTLRKQCINQLDIVKSRITKINSKLTEKQYLVAINYNGEVTIATLDIRYNKVVLTKLAEEYVYEDIDRLFSRELNKIIER